MMQTYHVIAVVVDGVAADTASIYFSLDSPSTFTVNWNGEKSTENNYQWNMNATTPLLQNVQ